MCKQKEIAIVTEKKMRRVRTEDSCVLKDGWRLSLKIRSCIFIQKTTFREINWFSEHPVGAISPKEPFGRTELWGTEISIHKHWY